MKKRLFAAIVVMACLAVSCQKNEEDLPTFEARTESGSAKTELVGSIIQWVSGDQVKMFGDFGYAIYDVTPRSGEPTWATLTPSENHGLTGLLPYRFVYPASMASGGATTSDNNNTLYVTYPTGIPFNCSPLSYFPMYGESDQHDVVFRNLGGMLKLHFQQDSVVLKEIIIEADEKFSGRFSINTESIEFPLSECTNNTYNRVTARGNVNLEDGYDLYVSMPAGEYHHMKLTIVNTAFDTCVKESNAVVVVNRSEISTINVQNLVFDRTIGPYYEEYWWGLPSVITQKHLPNFVDLGLPSGTLWSQTIVWERRGATNFGDWSNPRFILYDSVAIPTRVDIEELAENCSISYVYESGAPSYIKLTSTINGAELLIPWNGECTEELPNLGININAILGGDCFGVCYDGGSTNSDESLTYDKTAIWIAPEIYVLYNADGTETRTEGYENNIPIGPLFDDISSHIYRYYQQDYSTTPTTNVFFVKR